MTTPSQPPDDYSDSFDSSDDDDVFLGWDHDQRATQREARLQASKHESSDDDDDDKHQSPTPPSTRTSSFKSKKPVSNEKSTSGVSFRERLSLIGGINDTPPPISNETEPSYFAPPNVPPGPIEEETKHFSDDSSYSDDDDDDASAASNNSNDASSSTPQSTSSLSSTPSFSSISTISRTSPLAYSVRIRVLSCVDLPPTLTPNEPLCPLFKIGLSSSSSLPTLERRITRKGIAKCPRSRTVCSSLKILSSRDCGSADWYEEIRWDGISKPLGVKLIVELCCRPPPPIPSEKEEDATTVTTTSASNTTSSPSTEDPSSKDKKGLLLNLVPQIGDDVDQGGLSTVKAFWRRGRQTLEQKKSILRTKSSHVPAATATAAPKTELEQASAAAAVARFLMDKPPGGGEDTPLEHQTLSLKHAKPPKALPDLRLGNLILPLDQLPLDEISNVAFLEKWYPLDTAKSISGGNEFYQKAATKAFSRSPSLLLEICFAPSSYLDNCEEEHEQEDDDTETNAAPPQPSQTWEQPKTEIIVELDDNSDDSTIDDEEAHFIEQKFGAMPKRRKSSITIPDDISQRSSFVGGGGNEAGRRDSTASAKGYLRGSMCIRSSIRMSMRNSITAMEPPVPPSSKKKKEEKVEPVVEPGVVDFICILGARDIGNQRDDDGAKGWVQTQPECCVLERFPPTDEFHTKHDRNRTVALQDKIEWFAFPEGVKLWRGTDPPTAKDLNLTPRDSPSAAPPNITSSIAAFDACLNCTTSFSWFMFSSTSEDYGSRNVKTYGAVIRFYAPAPLGVDATQDDYAQTHAYDAYAVKGSNDSNPGPAQQQQQPKIGFQKIKDVLQKRKTLWVPLGICLTSNLPIVGVLEAMLLRICETIAARRHDSSLPLDQYVAQMIHPDLVNLILNYQAPIYGVLHCSIPFLTGDRLHLTLPPNNGLPPLPHGGSVASVCRLLGAEGFTTLLAAVLTECKILLHSHEVSNLGMVAEVMTTLIYPFDWALPYIPVLPDAMLEFVEAPLSYFLGVPSCTMKWIDKKVLQDVVVIDLDNGFSAPDYFDGSRGVRNYKLPSPLPATVSSNISKSVFRLLREEEEVEDQYFTHTPFSSNHLPRLEQESLAEREFRISVAIQICGLVRGYQDCLFFVSANQPVFNRDRFLRNAPSLFEERRDNLSSVSQPQKILSPRSKRFLSLLINTQHFHQLLEKLDHENVSFFHEVMDTFETGEEGGLGRFNPTHAAVHLSQHLQKIEDVIPTYKVTRKDKPSRKLSQTLGDWEEDDRGFDDLDEVGEEDDREMEEEYDFENERGYEVQYLFTHDLLKPICFQRNKRVEKSKAGSKEMDDGASSEHVRSLSLQYLVELEKNPWTYTRLFDVLGMNSPKRREQEEDDEEEEVDFNAVLQTLQIQIRKKVTLKEAIGERRFRAWQLAQKGRNMPQQESLRNMDAGQEPSSVDLKTLLSSVDDEMDQAASTFNENIPLPPEDTAGDAKDKDVLRRCLQRAYEGAQTRTVDFTENGRDLIRDAEVALHNPSAQKFLLSVLSQRTRLEDRRRSRSQADTSRHRGHNPNSVSRLVPAAFECLVRLCNAMLEACMEVQDYEGAYRLLTHTAGFCTMLPNQNQSSGSNKTDQFQSSNEKCDESDREQQPRIIYMTARIGMHPIFADLRLWERVLVLHQKDQQQQEKNDKLAMMDDADDDAEDAAAMPNLNQNSEQTKDRESSEYEAAVSTLFEMLGYGVPSEELARFATRVSEARGWFGTERGQALLVLALRLSVRRDEGDTDTGVDLDLLGQNNLANQSHIIGVGDATNAANPPGTANTASGDTLDLLEFAKTEQIWEEIAWFHPTSLIKETPSTPLPKDNPSLQKPIQTNPQRGFAPLLGMLGASQLPHPIQNTKIPPQPNPPPPQHPQTHASTNRTLPSILHPNNHKGRAAITSMANFGAGLVATGALDGSVFLAHTIHFKANDCSLHTDVRREIRGVKLEWNSGLSPQVDADGAISCLAASRAAGRKRSTDANSEEEFWSAMEGCKIIAGTTGGALNVWSVKDVYQAANQMNENTLSSDMEDVSLGERDMQQHPPVKKLQYALQGKALSGHRGGVTCIEVPSPIYRPDALVSGGADGLIKLWSLRGQTSPSSTATQRINKNVPSKLAPPTADAQRPVFGARTPSQRQLRMQAHSDAQATLAGHGGRILCVRTAWHGDRLLSGGADRTVRLWDLAVSGGKCLQTLVGHYGWVTQAHYWGPHTIVSASTDRSVALWDARLAASPLFILRYHNSYVSDLLLGTRTEPLMVSAGGDGSIATWDFRALSSSNAHVPKPSATNPKSHTIKTIRSPVATMHHFDAAKRRDCVGGVLLGRGHVMQEKSVISASFDGKIREWEIGTGRLLDTKDSKHQDALSCLRTFKEGDDDFICERLKEDGMRRAGGMITTSWDGTVRLRRLVLRKKGGSGGGGGGGGGGGLGGEESQMQIDFDGGK